MADYLSYRFEDSPEFVETFDEAPLWSASFGLLLLKHLELRHNISMLDVGSGAGFPLLEIAQRLGQGSKCYGLDPWTNANNRARMKITRYGITNTAIVDGSAENMPFDRDTFDLIVSNLGINNFDQPDKVMAECVRVLKPGGRLALTSNITGHWQEFYKVFEDTLSALQRHDILPSLRKEEEHRGSVESIGKLLTRHGLTISKTYEEKMEMKFMDGSAFLNHYFVKLGWLGSWKSLIPVADQKEIFHFLETNLNSYARAHRGLTLTVPMVYIEAVK